MQVLVLKKADSVNEFIGFWKRYYDDLRETDKKLYWPNIVRDELDKTQLGQLFEWKNGMPLKGSGTKEKAFQEKVLPKLKKINDLKTNFDLAKFKSSFKDVSAIWRVVILHIIRPHV